ncbi:NAD(P)-binding protein [Sistotremastrum niveocremeum HHB9708]|uniref:NAD(P)-binding protein n=1 Tax=Sistotremastrum niveocremeum HHB9708 TaxID=1314777 RepID=A0A164N9T8_9AGAM|nr:NAD(P)-binding protein [Sistotremastrum niveocremeum HHB9708]
MTDLPDLHGKVIIVTGASSGVGKYTALHLARKGAKIYLACRNERKTLAVIKELQKEGLGPGNGTLHYIHLNLSDLESVKKSAEEFLARESRLDVLINNAGYSEEAYVTTRYGLGESIVANFLGPFLFTKILLPLLKSTAKETGSDVRILNVSSEAHRFASGSIAVYTSREALSNKVSDSRIGKSKRYGYAKLANILHINELQRRLSEEGVPITCISLHPGAIATPAVQNWVSYMLPFGKAIARLVFMAQEDGAITSAFAAGGTEIKLDVERYKGVYLVPFGKIGKKSKEANDPQKAVDLWNTAEKILKELNL